MSFVGRYYWGAKPVDWDEKHSFVECNVKPAGAPAQHSHPMKFNVIGLCIEDIGCGTLVTFKGRVPGAAVCGPKKFARLVSASGDGPLVDLHSDALLLTEGCLVSCVAHEWGISDLRLVTTQ